jgi:hypothetical protein
MTERTTDGKENYESIRRYFAGMKRPKALFTIGSINSMDLVRVS